VLSKGRSETGGLDTKILIKENARVMLTTNVDISDRLINGQLGTVIKVSVDNVSNKPSTIFVKFDDSNAGISAIRNSSSSFARENNLVPIKPVLARIKVRPGKPSSPEMQRLQFPVTLAWACTVHKEQGLTRDNIVVSFDLKRKGILTMVRYM
jgi:ATP-dependent exoDNAse (exonuclease V) alpha subunit